jgi:hypothetical protein
MAPNEHFFDWNPSIRLFKKKIVCKMLSIRHKKIFIHLNSTTEIQDGVKTKMTPENEKKLCQMAIFQRILKTFLCV